eukprot:s3110_g6.t1
MPIASKRNGKRILQTFGVRTNNVTSHGDPTRILSAIGRTRSRNMLPSTRASFPACTRALALLEVASATSQTLLVEGAFCIAASAKIESLGSIFGRNSETSSLSQEVCTDPLKLVAAANHFEPGTIEEKMIFVGQRWIPIHLLSLEFKVLPALECML